MQSSSTEAATTLPITVRRCNHSLVHSILHSQWLLHSAMRGGFTSFAGSGVRPAFSSSLIPRAKGRPTTLTFSRISLSKEGMLTTNSSVARTLWYVSLSFSTVNEMHVGSWFCLTHVANEAAFTCPSLSTVVIMTAHATGEKSRSQCSYGTSTFRTPVVMNVLLTFCCAAAYKGCEFLSRF